MTEYPTYAYGLVENYVHTKIGDRIIQIYSRLNKFISDNGSILEKVYQNMRLLDSKVFGEITSSFIEKNIRQDLEQAEEGLLDYNDVFDSVGQKLFDMTDHEDISAFLAESNVPSSQIAFFRSELRLYWDATYGKTIERLARIHKLLEEIKATLEREVYLLRAISSQNFYEGFSSNMELRNLFLHEREVFYQILEQSKIPEDESKQLEALLLMQLEKVKIKTQAFKALSLKVSKRMYQEAYIDLATSKTELEKAVLMLSYILGAFRIMSTIPAGFILSKSKILRKTIFGNRELSATSERAIKEAMTLTMSTAGMQT
jgi:hypothetical protein